MIRLAESGEYTILKFKIASQYYNPSSGGQYHCTTVPNDDDDGDTA